jgi:hypothetical protein
MRVVTQDGHVFEGTAVQIAQAMKDIAFGSAEMSLVTGWPGRAWVWAAPRSAV